MKEHSSPWTLSLIVSMWLALILGCTNKNEQPKPLQASNSNNQAVSQPDLKFFVDIPQLIKKSPTEVEKVLGKPVRITKITNDPEMMPGEYREYKMENSYSVVTEHGLVIQFYKGRAIHFSVDLPRQTDTPEEALLMVGIDVKNAKPWINAPGADRFTGYFNGIDFKDIAALKLDMQKYTSVQAEIAK